MAEGELLKMAQGFYRLLAMVQGNLGDMAVDLEDGKPVLAYKRLQQIGIILAVEQRKLSDQFPGEM